ncbi:MAG: RluA family pseudouridine synthase [Phycisphaerales bacterium]|nr:RluA family pseudouridine synthase [Phycisphaerales bacterium]
MKRQEQLRIILEDGLLVAVEKPAGLATIPGRGESDSVIQKLARQIGLPASGQADPRLRLVHRLDKETSGILLLAKTIDAQRWLSQQFQNNTIQKQYLALVSGKPSSNQGQIDLPLAVDPLNRKKMAIVKKGRPALTLWQVEQIYRHGALLRVFPRTGKTHQIRVHLKAIGHPLMVDALYHPLPPAQRGIWLSHFKRGYRTKTDQPERPLIDRLTLHAEQLSFVHPDGREIQLHCQPPKDFRSAVSALEKFARV